MQGPVCMQHRLGRCGGALGTGAGRLSGSVHHLQSVPTISRGRASVQTAASIVAEPAVLPVKSFSGEPSGSEQLALRVADSFTATGLVHRSVVTVRQNARRVC